ELINETNQLVTRAALISERPDQPKRQLVLHIERIPIDVRCRRLGQCAVNLNRAIRRRAGRGIDADCERRIWRKTKRRVAGAEFVKNLPAGKRTTEVSCSRAAAD